MKEYISKKEKINKSTVDNSNADIIFTEIKELIEDAKRNIATTINSALALLYWKVGRIINEEILKSTRADYGKQIIATLSQQLSVNYGNGFSYSNLTRMIKFVESFPDYKIVATLSQQLSWSHFKELLPLKKEVNMKNLSAKLNTDDEMRPEYDFTDSVPNKYASILKRQGYLVRIEPEVYKFFDNDEKVNQALKAIISIMPRKKDRNKRAQNKTPTNV
ncbi:MAG: DUF1016 domain-containing protein [Ignavibacteria bacterium]|jgi:hypothetical protein|nr:DUF1016 domain-containing protein [Ignavibacteria bacterium]